ncbi:hypothetical protein NKH77_08255 [Streptomyces sp. M19]
MLEGRGALRHEQLERRRDVIGLGRVHGVVLPQRGAEREALRGTPVGCRRQQQGDGDLLPELGDQRAAITHYNSDLEETTADAQFRVGTVFARVEYHPVPDAPEWNAEFETMASTVAARAQRVQNA